VSDDDEETDWLPIPEDGLTLLNFGDDGSTTLLVTLENYEGPLKPDHIYEVTNGVAADVDEDVDEDAVEEEETEEEEGENESEDDPDELDPV
jgi:hypothetical protein